MISVCLTLPEMWLYHFVFYLYSHQHLVLSVFCFWNFSHCNRYVMILICFSQIINEVGHLFMCLSIAFTLLWSADSNLLPIFYCIYVFLSLIVGILYIYTGYPAPLSVVWVANIFFQFGACHHTLQFLLSNTSFSFYYSGIYVYL